MGLINILNRAQYRYFFSLSPHFKITHLLTRPLLIAVMAVSLVPLAVVELRAVNCLDMFP